MKRGAATTPKKVYGPGLLAELADALQEPVHWTYGVRVPSRWQDIRNALSGCDEETYRLARAKADSARASADLTRRCLIAYAFVKEASWIAEATAEARARGFSNDSIVLLASIVDVDAAVAIVRRHVVSEAGSVTAHAADLATNLGNAAVPVLVEMVTLLESKKAAIRWIDVALRTIASIESDDAGRALADRLAHPRGRKLAVAFFTKHPARAPVLADAAKKRGRVGDAARAILAASTQDAEGAASHSQDGSEVEADEAEIPEILRRPPWRRGKGKAKPRVLDSVILLDIQTRVESDVAAEWQARVDWVPPRLLFSSRAAVPITHAWLTDPTREERAESWLGAFPELAAAGMIPFAVGDASARRRDAIAVLWWLAANGHATAVRRGAAAYGPEVASLIEEHLQLDPLELAPFEKPSLPTTLVLDALPQPRMKSGRVLPRDAVRALAEMLTFVADRPAYAGAAVVRAACEPTSLEQFVVAVFENWLAIGGGRSTWPMMALGELGGDTAARLLGPKVRSWPTEGGIARAELGLRVLERIGTDMALVQIAAVNRSRFAGLAQKAGEILARAAKARALTVAELEDELVPTLGLDDAGGLTLDLGPRHVRVSFDEQLRPVIRDEDGTSRKTPRGVKGDDPAKARIAEATFEALKSDAESVGRAQIARLERAMVAQRRWQVTTFIERMVRHPLLAHLVRRLVWAGYDDDASRMLTFRVAEDSTQADLDDAQIELTDVKTIAVAHPLDLGPELTASWSRLFADYALLQPFEQLDRTTYTPTSEERERSATTRLQGTLIDPGRLFALEHRGWSRRRPFVDGCSRTGPRAIEHFAIEPGFEASQQKSAGAQRIGALSLVATPVGATRLGQLSPIEFSELIRDVASCAAL